MSYWISWWFRLLVAIVKPDDFICGGGTKTTKYACFSLALQDMESAVPAYKMYCKSPSYRESRVGNQGLTMQYTTRAYRARRWPKTCGRF